MRNLVFAPVHRARTLAEFTDLIRQEAGRSAPGAWVQTSNAWHEKNLQEKRLPTAMELDAAAPDNPVLARRGGHVAVGNSRALQMAGYTRRSSDPPGGKLGRARDGSLDGMLEGSAIYRVAARIPSLALDQALTQVQRASQTLAAVGLGTVRDPVVREEDLPVFRAASERGLLSTRHRAMLLLTPSKSGAEVTNRIDAFAAHRDSKDMMSRVWGLKCVMDGGAEGGALDAPYVSDPHFRGHLNWEPELFAQAIGVAVDRGWRVGTHCVGDLAVRTVLDAYEKVISSRPALPQGTLVLEHAFLANALQRARAVRLGVSVTVQHALLFELAGQLLHHWGAERTRQVMPVRDWLAAGANLSAGTDYPVGSIDPLACIWGFVTRQTRDAGILGPEQAIDVYTALRLYTAAGAALDRAETERGTLEPGKSADLVALSDDPTRCPTEQLLHLSVTFTMLAGRATHDPEHYLE
jgi:predicted amidohydrolase YtcJ